MRTPTHTVRHSIMRIGSTTYPVQVRLQGGDYLGRSPLNEDATDKAECSAVSRHRFQRPEHNLVLAHVAMKLLDLSHQLGVVLSLHLVLLVGFLVPINRTARTSSCSASSRHGSNAAQQQQQRTGATTVGSRGRVSV